MTQLFGLSGCRGLLTGAQSWSGLAFAHEFMAVGAKVVPNGCHAETRASDAVDLPNAASLLFVLGNDATARAAVDAF